MLVPLGTEVLDMRKMKYKYEINDKIKFFTVLKYKSKYLYN